MSARRNNCASGERSLADIPEIKDVEVNIVWNPPWNKEMMSRYAKIALGIR